MTQSGGGDLIDRSVAWLIDLAGMVNNGGVAVGKGIELF